MNMVRDAIIEEFWKFQNSEYARFLNMIVENEEI